MDPSELNARYDQLPKMELDSLRVGDLLFCSDNGKMQQLFDLVGDRWVHVAIVVEIDGELRTAEVGSPDHVVSRPIGKILETYERVGVGRPGLSQLCVDKAVGEAGRAVDEKSDSVYAWDDFVIAGVSLVTRRLLPVDSLERLARSFADISSGCEAYSPISRTCSSFIHSCFSSQGEGCEISVDLTDIGARALAAASEDQPPTLTGFETSSESEQRAVLADFSVLELGHRWMSESDESDGSAAEKWMSESDGSAGEKWMSESDGHTGALVQPSWLQVKASGPREREQVGRSIVATARLLTALISPDTPPGEAPRLDGRWVSPADLWRSKQIHFRARLTGQQD